MTRFGNVLRKPNRSEDDVLFWRATSKTSSTFSHSSGERIETNSGFSLYKMFRRDISI